MKLTEEQEKERYKKTLDIIHEMEKEFEALNNAYKVQETALKKQHEDNGKLERRIHLLEVDLNLESVAYGRTTTRDYALKAFNQSTTEANWEGLGEHPVIKNIYKSLKTRASDEGLRADNILKKLEKNPNYDEFMLMLKTSWFVKEIKEEMDELNVLISGNRTTQSVDRTNIYEKYGEQRDKIADLETAIHMIDFVMGDTFDSHHSAFIFLMGAFAEMGKGQIEEGLRFMLKKPKEKPNNETTSETPQDG